MKSTGKSAAGFIWCRKCSDQQSNIPSCVFPDWLHGTLFLVVHHLSVVPSYFDERKIIIPGIKFPSLDTQITAADNAARSAELIVPSRLLPHLTGVLLGFVWTVTSSVLSTSKIVCDEKFSYPWHFRNEKQDKIYVQRSIVAISRNHVCYGNVVGKDITANNIKCSLL
jgi:hypothetical protein